MAYPTQDEQLAALGWMPNENGGYTNANNDGQQITRDEAMQMVTGDPNQDPVINGQQWRSLAGFANNNPDPNVAMQQEVAALQAAGGTVVNDPTYGWIAKQDQAFNTVHDPNYAQNHESGFDRILGTVMPMLIAGGMGAGALAGFGGLSGIANSMGITSPAATSGYAAADTLGLQQMGQAAGLSGRALTNFVSSGGTLGSAAAGGGGIGTGSLIQGGLQTNQSTTGGNFFPDVLNNTITTDPSVNPNIGTPDPYGLNTATNPATTGLSAANTLGLQQMGQAAGLTGTALDSFVSSGGTMGSTAAGGGGVGTGAAGIWSGMTDPTQPPAPVQEGPTNPGTGPNGSIAPLAGTAAAAASALGSANGTGTWLEQLLRAAGIDPNGLLGSGLNGLAAVGPGLAAINYARNLGQPDTTNLQNIGSHVPSSYNFDTSGLTGVMGRIPSSYNFDTSALTGIMGNVPTNQSFDTSRLTDAYNQFDPNTVTGPYDLNTAAGRDSLTSGLSQRGMTGSSFGNSDIANYGMSRDVGRQELINNAITQKAGIAQNILGAQETAGSQNLQGYGIQSNIASNLLSAQQNQASLGLQGLGLQGNIAGQLLNSQQNQAQLGLQGQGLQAGIANNVLTAQTAQQKNKLDLYGRALLALSGGLNPRSTGTLNLSGLFGQ